MNELVSFLREESAVTTVEVILILIEIGGTTLRSLS